MQGPTHRSVHESLRRLGSLLATDLRMPGKGVCGTQDLPLVQWRDGSEEGKPVLSTMVENREC